MSALRRSAGPLPTLDSFMGPPRAGASRLRPAGPSTLAIIVHCPGIGGPRHHAPAALGPGAYLDARHVGRCKGRRSAAANQDRARRALGLRPASRLSATAARMRAFKAAWSSFSPSWMSMARLTFPSRLELNRRDGSFSPAPLANVILTMFL